MRDLALTAVVLREGQSEKVKDFARQVRAHRAQAQLELRALAAKTRLVLPDRMGAHQRMQVNALQKLSGPALDRRYLEAIAQSDYLHFYDLELHNGALRVDPEVKAFAKEQHAIISADMTRAARLKS